jgi:hypothetical protein
MNNSTNLNSNSNYRNRVEVLLTLNAHKLFFYGSLLDILYLQRYSHQFGVKRAYRFELRLPFW